MWKAAVDKDTNDIHLKPSDAMYRGLLLLLIIIIVVNGTK